MARLGSPCAVWWPNWPKLDPGADCERGLRVDYHTMWNFADVEGLGFRKDRAGQ